MIPRQTSPKITRLRRLTEKGAGLVVTQPANKNNKGLKRRNTEREETPLVQSQTETESPSTQRKGQRPSFLLTLPSEVEPQLGGGVDAEWDTQVPEVDAPDNEPGIGGPGRQPQLRRKGSIRAATGLASRQAEVLQPKDGGSEAVALRPGDTLKTAAQLANVNSADVPNTITQHTKRAPRGSISVTLSSR